MTLHEHPARVTVWTAPGNLCKVTQQISERARKRTHLSWVPVQYLNLWPAHQTSCTSPQRISIFLKDKHRGYLPFRICFDCTERVKSAFPLVFLLQPRNVTGMTPNVPKLILAPQCYIFQLRQDGWWGAGGGMCKCAGGASREQSVHTCQQVRMMHTT